MKCKHPKRPVVWRYKRKLYCHVCCEELFETTDVNLDYLVRLSDNDKDFPLNEPRGRAVKNRSTATASASV